MEASEQTRALFLEAGGTRRVLALPGRTAGDSCGGRSAIFTFDSDFTGCTKCFPRIDKTEMRTKT